MEKADKIKQVKKIKGTAVGGWISNIHFLNNGDGVESKISANEVGFAAV